MRKRIPFFHAVMTTYLLIYLPQPLTAASIPTDAEVLTGIRAADAAVGQGNTVYRIEEHGRPTTSSKYPTEIAILRWVYRSNGDFKLEQWNTGDIGAITRRQPDVRHDLQGKNNITLVRDQGLSWLHVTYERMDTNSLDVVLSGPTAGPSYVTGTGLSTVRHLNVVRKGGNVFVEGLGYQDTPVKAEVDPSHGYIAKSIERFIRGGVATRWEFGPPRRTPDGVWYPSLASVIGVGRSGKKRLDMSVKPIQIDFRSPNDAVLAIPRLDQIHDLVAIDGRLGAANEPKYSNAVNAPLHSVRLPSGVSTVDELLPYTQHEIDELARSEHAGLMAMWRNRVNHLIWGLLFLGTFASFMLVIYRDFRHKAES